VRFIVDRCAGKRIAAWLSEQGHEVAVAWDKEPDPGDAELLARAAREDRVLVTMDKDFGEHVFVKGSPHCGLVRLPDVPAARRVALLEAVLKGHSRDLEERAIVTVRGERIRISRTPKE
jgi:predicted nuclease of predicted toxin-antitoxin system